MRETLLGLLESPIGALGYEVVELEFHPQGRGGLLRVFIDKDGGVTVDDCELVSRQVSAVLDVEDPIPGAYTLEVSSPGLDRPLRAPKDFARFAGQQVRIDLSLPLEGRRRFAGTLKGCEAGEVSIEVDGELHKLPLSGIAKARLVPDLENELKRKR
ncbi:MAG TPA: ribosome maturation factor RimP [Gammaproteobacteria bacterium]|jgi:ribosome maturation factor RimP